MMSSKVLKFRGWGHRGLHVAPAARPNAAWTKLAAPLAIRAVRELRPDAPRLSPVKFEFSGNRNDRKFMPVRSRKRNITEPGQSDAPAPSPASLEILTIGHSTRLIDDFVRLLQAHGVDLVMDVRTIPRSRRNPQFSQDVLPVSLKKAAIGYEHAPMLGGLRRPAPDSINAGWRNASFRGYADYMQTPEFVDAVEKLVRAARRKRMALMCAEAVPWRCHRSLIADALVVRGIAVGHIMSLVRRSPHVLTPFAKVRGRQITYPPPGSESVKIRTGEIDES